jgi:hypothetical protein
LLVFLFLSFFFKLFQITLIPPTFFHKNKKVALLDSPFKICDVCRIFCIFPMGLCKYLGIFNTLIMLESQTLYAVLTKLQLRDHYWSFRPVNWLLIDHTKPSLTTRVATEGNPISILVLKNSTDCKVCKSDDSCPSITAIAIILILEITIH